MTEESTADDVDVVQVAARDALANAHSPYSGVKMGACLLSSDGRLFIGCSVESSDPGACISASAAALARAIGEGARSFERIVLVTDASEPRFPGGSDRQALSQFAPQLSVVAETLAGHRIMSGLAQLLPRAAVTGGAP